ncbi:group II intron-encoded protein ltrA [Bacillus cereus BAG6O-2]|nr:group II intron-encoded protein ltrA [Bacillus cereus BAG6O-2]
MRNPKVVLSSLTSKAIEENYTFKRLYRNLYNIEFFLDAYVKIYPNKGSNTKGINEDTIDGMSVKRIDALIEKLRNQTYQPNPARRTYIPKKNGKLRPLGLPTFGDKLVQEKFLKVSTNLHSLKTHMLSDQTEVVIRLLNKLNIPLLALAGLSKVT